MNVEVRLFALLRQDRFRQQEMALPDPLTLAELAGQLQIPREQIGMRLINGRHAEPDQTLADGDVVALFPAVGGG